MYSVCLITIRTDINMYRSACLCVILMTYLAVAGSTEKQMDRETDIGVGDITVAEREKSASTFTDQIRSAAEETGMEENNSMIGDYSARRRQKRMVQKLLSIGGKAAAILRGKTATAKLLTGAKQVNTDAFYRVFVKRGGLAAALKDYGSIKPSPVYKYDDDHWGFVWIAKVGDKNVLLSERGLNNLPEIKISSGQRFDVPPTDVIVYKD